MRRSSVLSAVAFICLFITAGIAQDNRSSFSVQGMADIPQNQDNIAVPHHASDSGGVMLGYRYNFKPWFAVQGDYGYTRDTQTYFDPVFGQVDIQSGIHELTAAAVITAPPHARVRPYVLGGVGGLFFRPTNTFNNQSLGINNQTGNGSDKGTFVFGGGVDFDISHSLAFRAEYRDYLFRIPDFQLGLGSNDYTNMSQPSIGVVWRF